MSQEGMSALERVQHLLDSGSFVETGRLVTARNTDFTPVPQEAPGDGVVTGYGTIDGRLAFVYSQDHRVLGGSMGEMHTKKILAVYEQALKTGAPVIGLIDCGGLRLQESVDALDAFGKLYLAQVKAKGIIVQIQALFGQAGGGMAISLALADFTFMESSASLFVNAPDAVEYPGSKRLDTSSVSFHTKETGLADFSGSEGEILSQIRSLFSILPQNNEDDLSYSENTDDLNRLTPELGGLYRDGLLALSVISDNYFVCEVKKDFAREMVTAFLKINGNTIGAVANRSQVLSPEGEVLEEFPRVLSHEGVDKAACFVEFCNEFRIPLLFLTDVQGYKANKCTERRMPQALASLSYAYAAATVPKVTLLTGEAFGTAMLPMGSKSLGADAVFAWEQTKVGLMDPKEAVKIIYAQEEDPAVLAREADRYEALQASALAAAKRGLVDDIISLEETRKRLAAAFEMLYTKSEGRPPRKNSHLI